MVGDYTISIASKTKADGFQWVLTNVYGPNKPLERAGFWEELDNVCNYWNLPWCLGGDFNTVLSCDEKTNCSQTTRSMKDFASFIEQHELVNLPLKGARYTWSNNQSNPVMCRLDRFLLSPSFELKFPLASQLAKPRPILITYLSFLIFLILHGVQVHLDLRSFGSWKMVLLKC